MAKNPYEIRFDLLSMAKDMLDRQYEQASIMAWEAMNKAMETNRDLYKDVGKYLPKMFTSEEIVAQAEKLQSFITDKK